MKTTIAAALGLALLGGTAAAQEVPLIERTKLFGNPTKANARLSPDGKWVSFAAPRDGVMNLWVAPAGDLAAAKPLTAEKTRPIRQYFWSPDSQQLLFVNDKGGDENFLLYGVDVRTGAQKTLTPFEKTRAEVVGTSSTIKDRILVAVNNRDPRWHDVYVLQPATGTR